MNFEERIVVFVFSRRDGADLFQKALQEKEARFKADDKDAGFVRIEGKLAAASLALAEPIWSSNRSVFVTHWERYCATPIGQMATARLQRDLEEIVAEHDGTMLVIDLNPMRGALAIEKREFKDQGMVKIVTKIAPREAR